MVLVTAGEQELKRRSWVPRGSDKGHEESDRKGIDPETDFRRGADGGDYSSRRPPSGHEAEDVDDDNDHGVGGDDHGGGGGVFSARKTLSDSEVEDDLITPHDVAHGKVSLSMSVHRYW